jgi:hypothetical protein
LLKCLVIFAVRKTKEAVFFTEGFVGCGLWRVCVCVCVRWRPAVGMAWIVRTCGAAKGEEVLFFFRLFFFFSFLCCCLSRSPRTTRGGGVTPFFFLHAHSSLFFFFISRPHRRNAKVEDAAGCPYVYSHTHKKHQKRRKKRRTGFKGGTYSRAKANARLHVDVRADTAHHLSVERTGKRGQQTNEQA